MRLKLRLQTLARSTADVVVTADATATVTEIASRLAAGTRGAPTASPTLRVTPPAGATFDVPPQLPLADAPIASGSDVEVVPAASADTGPVRARLRVISGPDTGAEFQLRGAPLVIGRDASADIVLKDRLVSKRHARIEAGQTVDLVDLNSANGILVDGGQVPRISLVTGSTVQLGDDVLRVDMVADAPATMSGGRGPVRFVRSPRVEERYLGEAYDGPEIPQREEPVPFPWIALVAPLALGVALVLFVPGGAAGGPTRFLYLGLSPILMGGTFVTQLLVRRRKRKLAIAQFDEQLQTLDTTLTEQREVERRVRLAEAPSTAEVLAASQQLGTLLWTRRPEHWSFLDLRLGTGTAPTRNTVKGLEGTGGVPEYRKRFEEAARRFENVDGVPFVENLDYAGAIGVAGPVAEASRTAHALLVQLAGLYSPAEVVFGAILSPAYAREFEWLKWLPHVSSPLSPLPATALADSAVSGTGVLMALEELIASRASAARPSERGSASADDATMEKGANVGSRRGRTSAAIVPAVVLLVSVDAPVDQARLISLGERAADAGVYPIWLAGSQPQLPAACRTFVSVDEGAPQGTLGFVREGESYPAVALEQLDAGAALDFARTLAGVTDAGAYVADASDMPRSVSLASLLGPEMLDDADAVGDRWRQNDSISDRSGAPMRARRAGRLRAIVGQSAVDAMHLDLRAQGPHALVGGTTGSGKSEFLQSWVLGMAAEYSPDRVTFLFVDYKGGSAFADCVTLPHCVGLVTDLSPHLVRRALTSLRAELRHREHLFNRKRAKDLLELEKRGDPEAPPALVIVIDEFAALVGEVPEFVDGVVDVAQRGRSLGIHLIMATQRPAGVIKDNLRANTNLRIALRMADEADSQDVVGDKVAAGFDPAIPGRGIAKTGPGRLTPFQSAYAGGWTTAETAAPAIEVAELRFGAERVWETGEEAAPVEENRGPTDQARLVRSVIAAARAAAIPAPRRPWLPELASAFDALRLHQRTDAQLVLGVVDVPEEQRQEVVHFRPDVDGNLAIYGTGGSGKTVTLRTLGAMAGLTAGGGPVDVYALDFAGNGLKMLEALPNVGSVVSGDDGERVVRLLRTLRDELDARGDRYPAVAAGSIADYRTQAGRPDEARILLLVDGFPAFRAEYETNAANAGWYSVFQRIVSEGRQLGIHVALTADRPGSVPTAISSGIQRRVVLRMADEQNYTLLDAPKDVLGPDSAPGRAIIDGREAQIAIVGAATGVADQARELETLGAAISRAGRAPAPAIGALPTEYPASALPTSIPGPDGSGLLVVGLSDDDLGPVGVEAAGAFVLSGPPASGRTTALSWLRRSYLGARPDALTHYLGNARSAVGTEPGWTSTARTVDDVAALARELTAAVADETPSRLIVIEGIGDFLSGPADSALVDLIKAVKRTGHLLIAEAESSAWSSSWPLLAEVKAGRTGLALQPEAVEGDLIFRTPFPRIVRGDFPPGRGLLVARGRITRVQLPLG